MVLGGSSFHTEETVHRLSSNKVKLEECNKTKLKQDRFPN